MTQEFEKLNALFLNILANTTEDNYSVSYFNIIDFLQESIKSLEAGNLYQKFSNEYAGTQNLVNALKDKLGEYEELNRKYKKLLTDKVILENEYNSKIETVTELERLKGIKEFIENNDLEVIEKEIDSLKTKSSADFRRFYQLINNANQELEKIIAHFNSNSEVQHLKTNQKKLSDGIYENIKVLSSDLKVLLSVVASHDFDLETKITEYNLCLSKLKNVKEDLNEIEKVHHKNLGIWKTHFEQNEEIWGNLHQKNSTSTYITILRSEVDKQLKIFDEEIGKIVRENDQISFHEYIKMPRS